jgi:hypothetical protein
MSRNQALAQTLAYFDDGHFQKTLDRRVAYKTESQDAASGPILHAYCGQPPARQKPFSVRRTH